MVLLGCLISSLTILAFGQQDGLDYGDALSFDTENGGDDNNGTATTTTTNITAPFSPLEPGDYDSYPNYSAPSNAACMSIVWLYSVGFSITFGTMFAKIRRVYLIFRAAAECRRVSITIQETAVVIAAVLCVDVVILLVWTFEDPLHWERTVLTFDKYGESLRSEGHCTSDHWVAYALAIGVFHFILLCIACVTCYVARDIPSRFSEIKFLR